MHEYIDLPAMGERIKRLRVEAQLSQQELTAVVGGTASKVSEWEKGRRLPDTEACYALARRFGVSVDYLLTGQMRVPGFVTATLTALLDTIRAGEGGGGVDLDTLPSAPPDSPVVFAPDALRRRGRHG